MSKEADTNLTDRLGDAFISGSEPQVPSDPGDSKISVEEFVDHLEIIAEAAERLVRLQKDLQALRETGLREQDVVDLLYGRNAGLNKGDIEGVMETLGEIDGRVGESPDERRKLLVRLVSSLNRDLKIADIEEVFAALSELRNQYG